MKKIGIISMVIFAVLAAGLAGCGTAPSLPSTPPGTASLCSLEIPLCVIGEEGGENYLSVGGAFDFYWKMHLLFTGGANIPAEEAVSYLPQFSQITEYLESIKKSNTILILPWNSEGMLKYQEIENKYPYLCPLSCDELESELESHSSPLLYFSQDLQVDKIRGIIVADQVDAPLAELLSVEEGIPLDVPFRYENGQLQILE